MVSRSFARTSNGLLEWEFTFDWSRTAVEGTYRLFMQLGDGSLMRDDTWDDGVGVNLRWGSIAGEHEQLAYRRDGVNTALAPVSGLTTIRVTADLDTRTYAVTVAGTLVGAGIAFDEAIGALDTVRFFTDAVSEVHFSGRRFDDVQIRRTTTVVNQPPPGSGGTLFADDFNRDDSSMVGDDWAELDGSGSEVAVKAGAMHFSVTADRSNRPMVSGSFARTSSGSLEWNFAFDWTRTGAEGTYRVFMQLGDGRRMRDDTWDDGIGVNLGWGSIAGVHEQLAYRQNGVHVSLAPLSGPAQIKVTADLDTRTYAVTVDGTLVGSGIRFDEAVGALDTLRFFTDVLSEANFSGRTFDSVLLETQ